MKNRWLIITAVSAGLICGICAGVLLWPKQSMTLEILAQESSNVLKIIQPFESPDDNQDLDFKVLLGNGVPDNVLRTALQYKYDWQVKNGSRIILVPHHLVAAREIVSLMMAAPKPKRVYLLTPDHLGNCHYQVCSPANLAGDTDKPWPQNQAEYDHEMALSSLAPIIENIWGEDVEVVPITINLNATSDIINKLSLDLTSRLQDEPESLLVGSIDASHYQTAEVADFHDILTLDVIKSLADLEVAKTEIDSPGVLRTILKTARNTGLGDVTIHAHTNSSRIMQAGANSESTSHILASFAPGTVQDQQKITMLFMGDMMFDRTVKDRSNRYGTFEYPFSLIRGVEDRFFHGQDLVVANLEGPVTTKRLAPDKGEVDFMFNPKVLDVLKSVGINAVSQANNHTYDQGKAEAENSRQLITDSGLDVFGDQVLDDVEHSLSVIESRGHKIALLGFNSTDNSLDRSDAERAVAQAKSRADYVVVFMHWGNEYQAKPNKGQVDLAHWFIDLGADAVIGSHPHWMQSVEVYNGHVIVYSLGNFIFDQDWSKETNLGLVAGLVLAGQESELHLFPIQIQKSQPGLLAGEVRQARLDYLASISDEKLSSQIKNGVIQINK